MDECKPLPSGAVVSVDVENKDPRAGRAAALLPFPASHLDLSPCEGQL